MKCPDCRQEMEAGYVGLSSVYPSALFFRKRSPSGTGLSKSDAIRIMDTSIIGQDWGGYTRHAYRCESCDITVIGRRRMDRTDARALEKEREEAFERLSLITGPRIR